jgi:aconitate hydratase
MWITTCYRNADDHVFLQSACRRFGLWFSRPGNGVSHPLHMEHFGVPGKTLLGSDSHTPASGALGMLAIGAGGLEVALAMAGEPFHVRMPHIWGVRITGTLPDWVSAKDIVLEMLRRHGVEGGIGTIIEYYGPGLQCLSTMDRHVIANIGTESRSRSCTLSNIPTIIVKSIFKSRGRLTPRRPSSGTSSMHSEGGASASVSPKSLPIVAGVIGVAWREKCGLARRNRLYTV